MKQSRFSLADVLTFLTALAFGFVCFLGKNFSTLGNMTISITYGVIVAVTLAATAFITKLFKKSSRKFKASIVLEILSLLTFSGLMAFYSYFSFPHYFNVTGNKEEIQEKLNNSITQSQKMFVDYELYAEKRKSLYESNLQTAVATKKVSSNYVNLGFDSSVPDNIQIQHKLFTLQSDLFPSNYTDSVSGKGIKDVATKWLVDARKITSSWKPIGIVNVVNEVEKNSEDWKTQLIGFSELVKLKDGFHPFTPDSLKFSNVKIYFLTTEKPTPIIIFLAFVAYLLMLLSYFISKRHTRKYLKNAPYEVIL